MTNPSSPIKQGICRRSVLKSVPVIAGAIISTNAIAQNLFVQTKLTHEAAKYQDHPKDGQQCELRPVRGACFMRGGRGSDRCERMVPTVYGQARLRISVQGRISAREFEPLGTLADAHCRRAILLRRTVTILPVSHRAYKLSSIVGHR